MQAWRSGPVPQLERPEDAPAVRAFDSASQELVAVERLEGLVVDEEEDDVGALHGGVEIGELDIVDPVELTGECVDVRFDDQHRTVLEAVGEGSGDVLGG